MSGMDLTVVASAITNLGFPIVAALGLVYFVHFVWKFMTEKLGPKLDDKERELTSLSETVDVLEQDLIRLNERLETIIETRR